MARTNKVNACKEFKHRITIGENGEYLYECPIEIKDQADLRNYGITWEDCRYLSFGCSKKMLVYYFKTPNRALAEYQWGYINNQHSSEYFSTRCMVPGKKKAFVRCRDTNKCAECPYGRTVETKQAPVVSLDEMVDRGWEPGVIDSAEQKVMGKIELEEIRARMDAEDERITKAYEAKMLLGYKPREIASRLDISEPRVYQLIARGKEIIKEYRAESME